MSDALVSLYQSTNINRKIILREKLRSIEMTILDSVTSYLTKVRQICDELVAIGEKVTNVELVNMALNGFLASWESFFKGICARENLRNNKGYGMTVSSGRLKWSQRSTRRLVMRT